jgi:hypothetical protein
MPDFATALIGELAATPRATLALRFGPEHFHHIECLR